MTRFPYDQLAKDYLQELLSPLGSVETSKDVAGEVLEIDVYFLPSAQSQIDKEILGLLGRFADTAALFEPFRNPVTVSEVRSCTIKLFNSCASLEREAKRNSTKLDKSSLPKLWILSPTASKNFLKGFGAELDENEWVRGVYFFGNFDARGLATASLTSIFALTIPPAIICKTSFRHCPIIHEGSALLWFPEL